MALVFLAWVLTAASQGTSLCKCLTKGRRVGGTTAPRYCTPKAHAVSVLAELQLGISLRGLQESPVLQDKQVKWMKTPGVGEAPSVGHGVEGSALVGVRECKCRWEKYSSRTRGRVRGKGASWEQAKSEGTHVAGH